MPRTAEDVENYLIQLGRPFEKAEGSSKEVGTATFVVRTQGGPPVAIRVSPPIVAVNAAIGPVPGDAAHQLPLFKRMLELNATDLMHASYGIEDGYIVLSAALAIENLDANELEATLADVDVALVRHTAELANTRAK